MHEDELMDIHKPKPVRSWRELFSEIGIIVLGVCIALSAEQAVEWWHWRGQVRDAQALVMAELTQNLVQGIFRVNFSSCIEHRLDGLAEIVDKASEAGRLPAIGFMDTIFSPSWPTAAWNTVVASQSAARFSPDKMVRLAQIYRIVESAEEIKRQELEAWTDLYSMAGPGRRLDPVSENTLRVALGRVRSSNRRMAAAGAVMMRAIPALGMPFTNAEIQRIETARKTTQAPSKCIAQPGGSFAHYGQGIFNTGLSDIEAVRNAPLKLTHAGE
jgi:hypothetical protein